MPEDQPLKVKRISHATMTTPDLERQIDYYTTMLGLQIAAKEPDRAFLATKQGLLALVLERGDVAACTNVAFQVAPDTDLAALQKSLARESIHAVFHNDPGPGLHQRLVFKDPKQTEIEIYSSIDLLDKDPAQSALSPLKLGHLAFNVFDVPAITAFYTSKLGFRVSDLRGEIFSFLRCGPDHHTVNFALTHSNAIKLHHFAFELKDWAEIQRACDFLGKNGYRMIWGPGRHLIGHNVFTYHRNPDGQIVELYTELDQMKDEDLGYFDPRPPVAPGSAATAADVADGYVE